MVTKKRVFKLLEVLLLGALVVLAWHAFWGVLAAICHMHP